MWKKLIFVAMILFSSTALASIDDMMSAGCRIETIHNDKKTGKQVFGTGVVFNEDIDSYYVLTAGHVVEKDKYEYIRFYNNTYPSDLVKAEVLNAKLENTYELEDLAVLKLSKLDLTKSDPIVIKPMKLAKDYNSKEFYSFGCANGAWPSLIKGYIISNIDSANKAGLYFYPPPALGRSGSAIYVREQNDNIKIVGIIIYTSDDYGGAINSKRITEILDEWGIKY